MSAKHILTGNHSPSPEQIAHCLGMSVEDVIDLQRRSLAWLAQQSETSKRRILARKTLLARRDTHGAISH